MGAVEKQLYAGLGRLVAEGRRVFLSLFEPFVWSGMDLNFCMERCGEETEKRRVAWYAGKIF